MIFETDSRKVKPGQIFVAIKGHTVDGHDYISDAEKNGASKIIAERKVNTTVPLEVVNDTQEYLNENIPKLYSDKLSDLTIVGITGTNGKTTTGYITYELLNNLGKKTAYIGTLGYASPDEKIETENTTPDILTTYKLLLHAKKNNIKYVVMEVSSHALAFERIKGLKLTIAAFTNLTEDHLEYHKTMENYLHEKLKIVNYLKDDGTLIVNNDDENSKYFSEKFCHNISLGFKENSDYKVQSTNITPAETTINFTYQGKDFTVTTNLTSKFNVYNYLTALAITHALGIDISQIITSTSIIKAPKGRCETYKVKDAYAVIDYAHTPDAVLKVITAYNDLKKGKVFTIIGCGGDRDPIKRPIMGEYASTLSDFCIFTSDNPRTEDPEKIMEDILKGVKTTNYTVELDRQTAIKKGLDMLQKNDILLILGKGHEDYQIINHTKIHLDDAEEVKKYIQKINN